MKIVTHGGRFYLNTVLSVAGLSILWPNFEIIRVKPQDSFDFGFDPNSIFVGVGNKYEPLGGMYDISGNGSSYRIGGASYDVFGLIWKSFGVRICEKVLEQTGNQFDSQVIAKLLDEEFIVPIDNLRNTSRNKTTASNLQDLAAGFNPPWYEKNQDYEKKFLEAVEVFRKILINQILDIASEQIAASKIKETLVLHNQYIAILEEFVPWRTIKEIAPEVKYLILPDRDNNSVWRVYCGVGVSKVVFPTHWTFTHPERLRNSLGIPGLIRVHPKGFYATFTNKSDAISFANLALNKLLKIGNSESSDDSVNII